MCFSHISIMTIGSAIARVLYISFAKNLPSSFSKINFGSRKIRNFLARRFAPGIDVTANIEKGAVFSSRIVVGENSNVGIDAYIPGKVIIGKYVMMGPSCNILSFNHSTKRIDIPMCQQGFQDERVVIIDDDVWIGMNVIILPGVHIGKGSIIGAGSVVRKDVPNYSVVIGNPAEIYKKRNID